MTSTGWEQGLTWFFSCFPPEPTFLVLFWAPSIFPLLIILSVSWLHSISCPESKPLSIIACTLCLFVTYMIAASLLNFLLKLELNYVLGFQRLSQIFQISYLRLYAAPIVGISRLLTWSRSSTSTPGPKDSSSWHLPFEREELWEIALCCPEVKSWITKEPGWRPKVLCLIMKLSGLSRPALEKAISLP